MLVSPGPVAWRQMSSNMRRRTFRMPRKGEAPGYDDGGIFPVVRSPFNLEPGSKVFTIGSCFAREVEAVLAGMGFNLPVLGFTMSEGELDLPAPHLLNEYNAGTILQRIESVAGGFSFAGDKGVERVPQGDLDMFLHLGSSPVTPGRLQERRRQIDELYRELVTSDVVVITLGLVESWFDRLHGCYVNRAPTQRWCSEAPDRFELQRMDLEAVHSRMSRAVELVVQLGVRKVIVTVSPVALEATFLNDSNPIANSYSKAVLRICADMLEKAHPEVVSYFPSYEIVTSFGTGALMHDNAHVERWAVEKVMHHMVRTYVPGEAAVAHLPVAEAEAAALDTEASVTAPTC